MYVCGSNALQKNMKAAMSFELYECCNAPTAKMQETTNSATQGNNHHMSEHTHVPRCLCCLMLGVQWQPIKQWHTQSTTHIADEILAMVVMLFYERSCPGQLSSYCGLIMLFVVQSFSNWLTLYVNCEQPLMLFFYKSCLGQLLWLLWCNCSASSSSNHPEPWCKTIQEIFQPYSYRSFP